MNRWQAARQLRKELLAGLWPDAGGGAVLAAGYVAEPGVMELFDSTKLPYIIVTPLDTTPDQERLERDLFAIFAVELVQQAWNDQDGDVGQSGLVGDGSKPRTASLGRGQLELEEPLRKALALAENASPVRWLPRVGATGRTDTLAGGVAGSIQRVLVEGKNLSRDRFYDPPFRVKAVMSGAGSGSVTFSWRAISERFDFVNTRIRRLAGTTAPTDPLGGDGSSAVVDSALTGAASLTVAGIPTGTQTFTWFTGCDELHATPATVGRYSSQRSSCSFTLAVT